MMSAANRKALLRQLDELLPELNISVVEEKPWHSMTFSGVRMCLLLTGADCVWSDHIRQKAQSLSDHDFMLNRLLVADIAIRDELAFEPDELLYIDALLLDE